MNSNLKLLLALIIASLGTIVADNFKVCVYDPEIVMSQSKELAGLTAGIDQKYQKEFDALKKEENALRDDVAKLQKDAAAIQAKMSVLNDAARDEAQSGLMERQHKLERKKRDLDESAERVSRNFQQERQKISMRFLKKLEDGVSDFAQANAYDVVLPKGPGVFALAKADQTSALVTHMNKKFGETKPGLTSVPVTVAKK